MQKPLTTEMPPKNAEATPAERLFAITQELHIHHTAYRPGTALITHGPAQERQEVSLLPAEPDTTITIGHQAVI